MNKKPILVVMAAGMGSRYGGLKQIDPIGPNGQLIIDYSIYDARRAGFETVVFIIKQAIEKDFKEAIGDRISKIMEVRYAYQELSNLPEGFEMIPDRVKPWGTTHAILSAQSVIDAPFAVINADDYYGPQAFQEIYDYLSALPEGSTNHYAMVSYLLGNTLTEYGHVARGVCEITDDGYLQSIVERTRIEKEDDHAKFTVDDGETWTLLQNDTWVSMNFWGFDLGIMEYAKQDFEDFWRNTLPQNPLKGECFLPNTVGHLIADNKVDVRVLHTNDRWHGVTYHQDKPSVMAAIVQKTADGLYPEDLWN